MNKDLVTVVIPIYNSEKYISECLNNAIAQTYSPVEIIIIDDGSTDNSVDICQNFSEQFENVRLIKSEHAGVSRARNTGIKEAKGKYIVFFDADDYPEKDLIEKYIWALTEWEHKDEISLLMCAMRNDNLCNTNVGNHNWTLESARGFKAGKVYLLDRNYVATLAWLKLLNFVTNKIYDRDIIMKNNLIFDESIQIAEDLNFNLDYLDAAKGKFAVINEPLYHYVKREKESLSISYYEDAIAHTKKVYERLFRFVGGREGFTYDDLMVIKSIYIMDLVARLSALYGGKGVDLPKADRKRIVQSEICDEDFQMMLEEVYRAKKITYIRYMGLKSKRFDLFYFLRGIYQILKA